MRNLILVLCLCLPLLTISDGAGKKVEFISGSPAMAKKMAKEEGKLYFIDFTASWCYPCQLMETTTFTDDRLIYFLKQHYIPVKVNVEDFDGIAWKQQYNVKMLPTIIVLDADGKVLGRFEEAMGATKMINQLKTFLYAKKPPVKTVSETPVSPPPPPPSPDPVPDPVVTTPTPSPPPAPAPAKPKVSGEGLYRFTVKNQDSKGFGVQIGVFAEYGNVLIEVAKLQDMFNEPIIVNINTLNNRKVYRIIVGAFYSENSARKYREKMSGKGITGIIKDLSTLR